MVEPRNRGVLPVSVMVRGMPRPFQAFPVFSLPHFAHRRALYGHPPGGFEPMTARRVLPALAGALMLASLPITAHAQCGGASWYALHSKTASGERMNPAAMTAAHRNLPFGTRVKVVNRNNGRSVTVRINDRGPFVRGRILDLSKAAAERLGFLRAGHTPVCLKVVG